MDKGEAINLAKQYKTLLSQHLAFESMYLYGSYAKGGANEDSDIDLAIIVDKIDDDFFAINPLLWKLRRQIDDRIEPIIIDKNNDRSGFLTNIQLSGIEIK